MAAQKGVTFENAASPAENGHGSGKDVANKWLAETEDGTRAGQANIMNDNSPEARWGLKQTWAKLSRKVEILSREIASLRDRADDLAADVKLLPDEGKLLQDTHSKKLADHQKKSMVSILRDVTAHRNAYPFKTPVDTKLYKDYLLRVSTPMDLGTVKTRLDAGQYTNNFEGYLKDIRQIFVNAYKYNAEETDVHAMAKQLEDKFEERVRKMLRAREVLDSERSPDELKIINGANKRFQEHALLWLGKERERLEPQMQVLEKQLSDLKAITAAKCQYVPFEEKQELIQMLNNFNEEQLEQAIQLVIYRHPGSLSTSTETYDLDLGSLDALTLRQLLAYSEVTRKRKRENDEQVWPALLTGAGCVGVPSSSNKRPAIVNVSQTHSITKKQPETSSQQHLSSLKTNPVIKAIPSKEARPTSQNIVGVKEPDALQNPSVSVIRNSDSTKPTNVQVTVEVADDPNPKILPRDDVSETVDRDKTAEPKKENSPQILSSPARAAVARTRSIGERSWSVLDREALRASGLEKHNSGINLPRDPPPANSK